MFELQLPKGMWSKEIYEDEGLVFNTINPEVDGVRLGDVILVGKKDASPYSLHVGICTGTIDETGDMQIIHATNYGKRRGICLSSMRDILRRPRYGMIHAVKRTKPEIFNHFVLPVMYLGQS